MIKKIRVKNFKSLKDVTVDFKQLNLIVGYNNTGKSNFFKALEFLGNFYYYNSQTRVSNEEFSRLVHNYQRVQVTDTQYNPIIIQLIINFNETDYFYQIEFYSAASFSGVLGIAKESTHELELRKVMYLHNYFQHYISFNELGLDPVNPNQVLRKQLQKIEELFRSILIYKPSPHTFSSPAFLATAEHVSSTAFNLVNFMFHMSQTNRDLYSKIEQEFVNHTSGFKSINTPAYKTQDGYKLMLKFTDTFNISHWANEVSEGVLYVLALLTIIYQPQPPRLLLLEEPEKGLHPRRIKHILQTYIQIAKEKEIQLVITTHSPDLVNYFTEYEGRVLIFEKKDGDTSITQE
jgi:predicted ATPase